MFVITVGSELSLTTHIVHIVLAHNTGGGNHSRNIQFALIAGARVCVREARTRVIKQYTIV